MSISKKRNKSFYDFSFGIPHLTPSKQSENDSTTAVEQFCEIVSTYLASQTAILSNSGFPATGEVLVGILQFFTSENEYKQRDVDNISKTILDSMRGSIYHDDGQVRSIIASKRLSKQVKSNFVFIGIKLINGETDVGLVHENLFQQALTMYNATYAKRS
jgi:Holliday junction resolvase RusA-like endonuclease